jgi:hypothetical protein
MKPALVLMEGSLLLDIFQQVEGVAVGAAGLHPGKQPGHGIQIVGQDIRLGLNDPVQVGGVFSEIGNQDLHLGDRAGLANVENGPGKDLRPLIFQVVSIH